MEKVKEVEGTVQYAGGKTFYVLGGDGEIYVVEYDKKHLARFKSLNAQPGQQMVVTVKNQGMGNEVVDVRPVFVEPPITLEEESPIAV